MASFIVLHVIEASGADIKHRIQLLCAWIFAMIKTLKQLNFEIARYYEYYHKTSNKSRPLVGNKTIDKCRRCSNYIFILNLTLALKDWANTTAR